MNASRSCIHCARPLPDGSPSSRRYCSAACRTAAYRARTTSTPPHPAVARVAELEAQLVAAGAGPEVVDYGTERLRPRLIGSAILGVPVIAMVDGDRSRRTAL